MKKFLTLLIAAAAVLMAAPEADARPHHSGYTYVSGRSSCGCKVYSQRYVVRYDRCGYPVYGVRRLPVTHRCRTTAHYRPQHRYQHQYRGRSYGHTSGVRYTTSKGRSYYSSRGRCR